MKDRFLYRAKRTDKGEWTEGSYVYTFALGKECPVVEVHKEEHWIVEKNGNIVLVDKSTICQCTGLNDKNGKLIWENDIMMCHGDAKQLVKAVFGKFYAINNETLEKVDLVIGWHYEVIPTDALSKCEPFCLSKPLTEEYVGICEFEVIGNIFDNQELLEMQTEIKLR